MTANQARAQMRVGHDVWAKVRGIRRPIQATVVQHSQAGAYVGIHPHLCFLPYSDIEEVR